MARFEVLFFALFIAVIAAFPADNPEFMKALEDCIKENKVDPENFKKIIKGEDVDHTLTSQKPYRCTFRCIHLKTGVINEEGNPVEQKAKAVFKLNDADYEIYKKCYAENKDTDLCDKTFNIQSCIIKNLYKKQ